MSDIDKFDIYKDNAAIVIAIDPLTPCLGTGSLSITRPTAGNYSVMMPKTGGLFTSGRARFFVSQSAGTLNDRYGFVFNTSQRDLTGGAGTGYWVFWDKQGASGALTLRRCTAGLATSTLLTTGSAITFVGPPSVLPVEITWILDVATLGGIRITVKHAPTGDYRSVADSTIWTGMTTDFDLISTSTILSTTQGEGLANLTGGASSSIRFDRLTVDPIVIGS